MDELLTPLEWQILTTTFYEAVVAMKVAKTLGSVDHVIPEIPRLRCRNVPWKMFVKINVRVNSSREHPPGKPRAYPGHLKNIQMPGPAGKFCWQIPGPPILLWWSNARTSSPSDPATCKIISCHILINITVSAQKNCIKQVTKWVTPTEKRQSKWFYCFYRSFMADKCSSSTPNDSVWLLDSERRWKWRPDVTRLRNKFVVVCKCPGGRDTINCKCPGPGTHRKTNARDLPGGDACGWNWLAHNSRSLEEKMLHKHLREGEGGQSDPPFYFRHNSSNCHVFGTYNKLSLYFQLSETT